MSHYSSRFHFGTDAEYLLSSLFSLTHNPPNSGKPDLTSTLDFFSREFGIEVKSSMDKKGILYVDQLYRQMNKSIYFACIKRESKQKEDDINFPYGAMSLRYSDIFMVPQEYAYYNYAIKVAQRTKDTNVLVKNNLKKLEQSFRRIDDGEITPDGLRQEFKLTGQHWQNLQTLPIEYLFNSKLNLREETLGVVEALTYFYPNYNKLHREQVKSPFGTIFSLVEEGDVTIFDELNFEMRENHHNIITISKMRENSLLLIEKIRNSFLEKEKEFKELLLVQETKEDSVLSFVNGGIPYEAAEVLGISPQEHHNLEKLIKWQLP
jgi:hypothetical protein